MLRESYLANMRNLSKSAEKIVVTRTAGHILSPSWGLLNDYRNKKIDWETYVERFKQEMNNDLCKATMRKIKWDSKHKDVYLICFEKAGNCHRHILVDMINNLDE